jgi:acetylglutamate/LysW-gamma-L-alpha-aminoadipate kinase
MFQACADVRKLVDEGNEVVLVHGGGAEADRLAGELGRPIRHLTSTDGRRSRYTDATALDTLVLGMLGRVKPALVAGLIEVGVRAVGLSGIDGELATARRTPPVRVVVDGVPQVVRDDLSGRIDVVDPHLIRTLLAGGYVPVVSPPALDPVAGPLNVDADRLAAALATALTADWLILLSDVPGLLLDPDHSSAVMIQVICDSLDEALESATGRMKVKVRTAAQARLAGVAHVILADGRQPSPVLAARAGAGTRFVGGER